MGSGCCQMSAAKTVMLHAYEHHALCAYPFTLSIYGVLTA